MTRKLIKGIEEVRIKKKRFKLFYRISIKIINYKPDCILNKTLYNFENMFIIIFCYSYDTFRYKSWNKSSF